MPVPFGVRLQRRYDTLLADLAFVDHAKVVQFEEFVAQPNKYMPEIEAFARLPHEVTVPCAGIDGCMPGLPAALLVASASLPRQTTGTGCAVLCVSCHPLVGCA